MFLTCKFKIHNPSKAKREQLDFAIREYTDKFIKALEYCEENLTQIKEDGLVISEKTGIGKYESKKIASLVKIKSDHLSGNVNEALSVDIGRAMSSYLTLDDGEEQEAGFPVQRLAEEYPEALRDLCLNGNDLEEEKKLTAKVLKSRKAKLRPILFVRSRDFTLLSSGKGQYFILLPIFSAKGREKVDYLDLFDIAQVKPFKKSSKTTMLLPIELGPWQYHKFILPMAEGLIFPKEAKLSKVGDEYFVDVSFKFEDAPRYEPKTYLGS